MAKSTKAKRPRHSSRQKRREKNAEEMPSFRSHLRAALMTEVRQAVAVTAGELVRAEVAELVGAPWSRKGENPLRRNGSCESAIFLDGERMPMTKPRVRNAETGEEHQLRRFEAFRSRDALDDDVKRLLTRGVSTRNYDPALTSLSDGTGLQKSAVSAAFVRAAKKDLDALNGRDLADHVFTVIFIDGIQFADITCVVALGVAEDGTKRILGLREGATENATLVGDLLQSLQDRDLTLSKTALFVLDGSKALRAAVKRMFGDRAVIQRCKLHKLRNVISYLPPGWQTEARRRLQAAWNLTRYDDAREALQGVLRWLKDHCEAAAKSLEEGFEETLTVHRLGVSGALRVTLMTTNPVESAFDGVRTKTARVKRWRDSTMVMRWAASGLVAVEKSFRRVKGFRSMPALKSALESLDIESTSVA